MKTYMAVTKLSLAVISEFLNNETKVEFDISMTVEEFKNKLVEIYPKLQNKQFGLLKADEKSEVLERLNISSSCYRPEDIYYSNLGRGRLYIRCDSEVSIFQNTIRDTIYKKFFKFIARFLYSYIKQLIYKVFVTAWFYTIYPSKLNAVNTRADLYKCIFNRLPIFLQARFSISTTNK